MQKNPCHWACFEKVKEKQEKNKFFWKCLFKGKIKKLCSSLGGFLSGRDMEVSFKKLKENVSLGFLVIKKHVLNITPPPYFLQNSAEGGGGVICSDIV